MYIKPKTLFCYLYKINGKYFNFFSYNNNSCFRIENLIRVYYKTANYKFIYRTIFLNSIRLAIKKQKG